MKADFAFQANRLSRCADFRRFALVVCLFTLAPFSLAAKAETPANAPRPVVSEIVASEALRMRDFPGQIYAALETRLGFLTQGQIARRPAQVGDRVKEGDVLAALDRITLSNDRAAAEAALRAAEARAELARQTFERTQELGRRGVVADAQLEQVTAARDAAEAGLTAARAALARAKDAETYGTLTAPADGIILAVHAEPGETIETGVPVVTLATGNAIEAVINVPTETLALLEPGAEFSILPRTVNAVPLKGRLRLIEPVADTAARAHRLRIQIDEPGSLRIGSLVSVSLEIPVTPVVTLPRAAVTEAGTVWRVGPGRALEAVPVTTGRTVGARVIITEGIENGDEILIRGVNSVQAGQIVGERRSE